MSTYTPIATQTLGSATPSVTFSSLPQNYTDLIVQVNNQMSGASGIKVRFNSDSGSNYSMTTLQGSGSAASSYRTTSAASIYNNLIYGDSTTANAFTPHIMQVQNYSNSSTYKTMLWRYGSSTQAGGNGDLAAIVGLWRNTSAITSIEISAWNAVNFAAGSTFTIYGVAAGNSSAKATGGNIVTTDGSYWYHAFTSSGVFIPSEALTADYLVVAGGGGSGYWTNFNERMGGGGAGGLRSTVTATGGGGSLESALSLSANTVYQAIVGAGGAGGKNGNNSIFATITSTGGGGGGVLTDNNTGVAGSAGGSGGGGSADGSGTAGTRSVAGGAASPSGQGYAGGQGVHASGYWAGGGGGGGAGAAGTDGNSTRGGNGGNGVQITALATPTGTGADSGYYAGGGSGSGNNNTGNNSVASSGTAGLGGGSTWGGSGGKPNTGGGGGAYNQPGGSGIIIIRYAV